MKDELEYWKKRCELAEDYISKSPCDPDTYVEQMDVHHEWEKFKRKTGICQKSTVDNVVGSYSLKVGDKIKLPSGLRAEVIKIKVKVEDEFGGEYYLSNIEVG